MSDSDRILQALQSGHAYRVIRFKNYDGPFEELCIVDGTREIERVPCASCGEMPDRPQYSDSMNLDKMKSVIVGCICGRFVSLSIHGAVFDRARGAMTSACNSWWNSWQDPTGHPNDLELAGGFVADAAAVDKLMGGETEPHSA